MKKYLSMFWKFNLAAGFAALAFILSFNSLLSAQSLRSLVNEGVEKYGDKNYSDSEVNFKKGIDKDPNNFHSVFNLGDTQYKQQRYDEAIKTYNQALSKTNDKDLKAKTFHNIGNAFLKSQKLEESINAYKNALRINPKDQETKYNLSYALNMQKQQQNNQNNQNKNDQNKDKQDQNNKDKQDNKDQDQNKPDQQQNQQSQQDNTKQQDKQNQQQKPQEDKNKMSKEEAERILNALKNNEVDLQKKLRKHEGKKVKPERDW